MTVQPSLFPDNRDAPAPVSSLVPMGVASDLSGVCLIAIRQAVERGEIPTDRIHGVIYVSLDHVLLLRTGNERWPEPK